ncbi:hypothetical protein ACFQHO_38685 [Actinomadura yumaensis]|uniref:hypothetical protein n=1 Tax=Actinomadura yumaensis TaxID=111807 RepID=UPI003611410B
MAVLERDGGRALDDFTVAWPAGAGIDRLCEGLASVPGVDIVGVWPTAEPQGAFPDAAVIGQVAASPARGPMILADAVPALLSGDWAGLAETGGGDGPGLVHASVHGLAGVRLPELAPLRPARSPLRTAPSTPSARWRAATGAGSCSWRPGPARRRSTAPRSNGSRSSSARPRRCWACARRRARRRVPRPARVDGPGLPARRVLESRSRSVPVPGGRPWPNCSARTPPPSPTSPRSPTSGAPPPGGS